MFNYNVIKTCYGLSVSAERIWNFLLSHTFGGFEWVCFYACKNFGKFCKPRKGIKNNCIVNAPVHFLNSICKKKNKLHRLRVHLVRLHWVLNGNSHISVFCCSEWFSEFCVLLFRMDPFKQVRLCYVLLRCCSCIMAIIARSSYVYSPVCVFL